MQSLSTRREPRVNIRSIAVETGTMVESGKGESAHSTAEFSLRRNGMSIVTAVPVVYDVMKPRGCRGERDLCVPYARRETMFANICASATSPQLSTPNDEWF